MNTKEKYEDIKLSLINEKTRDTLEKIRRATKDFTVQNDKADAYVSAVHSKLKKEKPEGLRSEDKKPEPKKPEPKKTTTKPEPKPKPAPKPKPTKTAVKATTTKVNALTSALQNDPLLKGLGKTDKKRDAGRTALPAGRRVSKKGWKNQYGSSKGGRVYYENRENHSDRKSPDYKGGYPYLAMGGYTHKNDTDGEFTVSTYRIIDGKKKLIQEKKYKDSDSAVTYAMMKGNFKGIGESIIVTDKDGKWLYKSINNKSKGGYMADGGNVGRDYVEWETEVTQILADKLDIDYGDASGIVEAQPFYLQQSWTKGLSAAETADVIDEKSVMAKGGYMAEGGEVKFENDYYGYSARVPYQGKVFLVEMGKNWDAPKNEVIITDGGFKMVDSNSKTFDDIYLKMLKAKNDAEIPKYAKGGGIKNQYEGREAEDIWNILSVGQRLHFLTDHNEDLNLKFEQRKEISRLKFDSLSKKIQEEFAVHVLMGQYAKGGYMAKGEDYEYKNTFKRFDSNVPVPQDDFKKFVDAWHKQKEGDKLDKAKYKVLKRSMGNYLGHKTVQEMEDYVEKTHKGQRMAKGGKIGFDALAAKVAKRYEGKKVPAKYQKEYGKTYDKQEAAEVGDKVAAKVYRQQQGKMADGGTVKNYKTYVAQYPNGMLYVRVKFSGADKDVMQYTANEENKKRAIGFAKRLAQKNNGTYEGFSNYSLAKGGEIKKGDMVIVDNPYWKLEAPFKAVKRKVKAVFGDEVFFAGGSNSDIKYVKKYDEGGELDQGFNDRLDESMGNRDGKETKMEATLKDRRNESKGENKAVGKRPYSSVHTMDKMAEGGELGNVKLPHNLKKYFTKPAGTIEVEINKLIPIRAREKGIANAERYMRLAYDGKMERRKPITIYKSRNGKYRIKDGNSTFAVAKKHNWKTIFAEVVENPNISKRKENSVFTVASKIRKDGESWASAVKRAGAMNKK